MKLCKAGLSDAAWKQAGVKLPEFDIDKMRAATEESPVWVHFGAGNIFRGFITVLQQRLLEQDWHSRESSRQIRLTMTLLTKSIHHLTT